MLLANAYKYKFPMLPWVEADYHRAWLGDCAGFRKNRLCSETKACEIAGINLSKGRVSSIRQSYRAQIGNLSFGELKQSEQPESAITSTTSMP